MLHRPRCDVDTWNSYFRSEILQKKYTVQVPMREACEEGKHAAEIKHFITENRKLYVEYIKKPRRSVQHKRAWTESCPCLRSLSVAIASARKRTCALARGQHTHTRKESERRKGDGAGHERVSFNFPVTITVLAEAHTSSALILQYK